MSWREQRKSFLSTFLGEGIHSKLPILFLTMLLLAVPALAAHDNNASLEPEWSPASQNVDYTVTICNVPDGGNSIDEVRIYRADNYTAFVADAKSGWYLGPLNPVKNYYQYTANDSGSYIEEEECTNFTFSATTPGPQYCNLTWKFETRDITDVWKFAYDTTSVDDTEPMIIKTVGEPKVPGDGFDYWITQDTEITIEAYDQGQCGISGLYQCEYRYDVDSVEEQGWTPIQWQNVLLGQPPHYFYKFKFDEDSEHFLEIRCYDIAGNEAYHSQTLKVDDTPPATRKWFEGPQKSDGPVEWIDGVTTIHMESIDGGEICHIDGQTIYYINTIDETENACRDPATYCRPQQYNEPLVEEYKGPFQKAEESCHILEYWAVDELGNEEEHNYNCFFVDKTAPEVIKDNGTAIPDRDEPAFTNPGNEIGAFHWLTTSMPVTFTCDDSWNGEVPHPSGDEELCFKVSYDYPIWGYITDRYCAGAGGVMNEEDYCCVSATPTNPFDFYFLEESMHNLEYYCKDAVEKKSEVHVQYYKVDDTPPTISKDMVGDYLGDCPAGTDLEHGDCYVADNGTSGFDVTVVDGGEICAVDDTLCTYALLWYTTEQECIDNKYEWEQYENACVVQRGNFPGESGLQIRFQEDSTHEFRIFCKDALENRTVLDRETFLVDSTPPETTKEYGTPTKVEGGYRWITSSTAVTLTADDEKVGVDEIYWRNTLLEISDDACVEQCQCESPLEEVFDLTGAVEGTITKTDNGDSFTWTINITSPSPVHNRWAVGMAFATSTDQPAFQAWYREYEEPYGWYYQDYGTGWNGAVVALPTEGITATGDQTGQVFTITVPKSKLGGGCDTFYWAAQARTNLLGKYPSTWTPWAGGSEEVSGMATSIVGSSGIWNIYTEPFYKPEESCHLIEYYAVDKLGNEEPIKSQCVFVDNTPPISVKEIGVPTEEGYDLGAFPETEGLFHWVTQDTIISLDCLDQGPHPVEQETVCYKVSFDLDPDGYKTDDYCSAFGGTMEGDWCCAYVGDDVLLRVGDPPAVLPPENVYEFQFREDSVHDLEYYCIDHLGNTEGTVHLQWYKVDDTPPTTTKTYIPEAYVDPASGLKYIDTQHVIELTTEDGGEICAIGVDGGIDYRVSGSLGDQICENCENWMSMMRPAMGPWQTYVEPFGIAEESCHVIEYRSVDLLGNVEDIKWQCVFVDKTPPVITKDYAGPQYPPTGGYPKWINEDTLIYLGAYDPEPHPSGIAEAEYRISLVNDAFCEDQELCYFEAEGSGEWTALTEDPITGLDDSCHLIEVYAVDNVDKETLHKQCVYVDNQAPDPEKIVGDPKTMWDGSGSIFYPEETLRCWNGLQDELECWKVTIFTPISMECIDPQPHPVDNEVVCFNVERNGEDETEAYCVPDKYDGTMNDDGYCCMPHTVEGFYFLEDCEHNLKYYCVDALENKGPIDEEKFKVDGDKFEIELNKKWNLISVPFALLNPDIEEVLEDVADKMESVWQYNAATDTWYVYHPGDSATSNLDELHPGWGYWVAMYDDDMLLLGGELFSPAQTPDVSIPIVEGWNLIGYFGTEGLPGYYGPNGNGKEAGCALFSLGTSYLDKGWSALITYWEPFNPDQWIGFDYYEHLDPGAGYWVFALEDGAYSYATTCGGFF